MLPVFPWVTLYPVKAILSAVHAATVKVGNAIYAKILKGGRQPIGAFAEYLVIPATNVVKCESGISEELCSSFDPLGNAIHTALAFNVIGEDVLITGSDPLVLWLRPFAAMWVQTRCSDRY